MRYYLIVLLFILYSCAGDAPEKSDAIVTEEWQLKADDGVSLYVKEFGKGDTLVVIHGGFGAEHSYLLSAFEPLADNYHFVMYDQRGSLRSSCADSMVTVSNHIKDIEALRLELGLERITIAAHSMGGYLAMRYASEYPGRVNKMILISSPPAKCNIDSLTEKIAEPAMKRKERAIVVKELEKYGLEKDSALTDKERSIKNRITFGAINLHDARKWREIKGGPLYYSAGAGNAASASMESERWNFITTLKKQGVPIHILHGDDDYLPYIYHNNWKDSISTLHFTLIKNAGHCLWIDNYDDYKTAFVNAVENK